MENIYQRKIQHLERSLYKTQLTLYAFMATIGLMAIVGFKSGIQTPDVIRAKKFELVDDRDVALGVFRLGKSGKAPVIEGFRASGNKVWYLGTAGSTEGGKLTLSSKSGKKMLTAGSDDKGGIFSLYNENGEFLVSYYGQK